MTSVTPKELACYRQQLVNEEKASATIEKYIHDLESFSLWLGQRELTKAEVLAYKAFLGEKQAVASVNSAISSLNSFFAHMGRQDLKAKSIKIQRQIFSSTEKELSKKEYKRLLLVARQKKEKRLYLLMQTICSTGIRVSEVKFITVQAVNCGVAQVNNKGKRRQVFLPKQLCMALRSYAKKQKIKEGPIFLTRNGNPPDRSNIWSDMKALCREAQVSPSKVFPHNLRHLFARTYYNLQKDIVKLADLLGHTSINTTRMYTLESGITHYKQIQQLGLLLC